MKKFQSGSQNILYLEMEGYFGQFYIHLDRFYVSDSGNWFCLDRNGNYIWKTSNLGIDGVIIEKFTQEKIYGSGEWDAPGGCSDFVLDLKTGKIR